MKLSYINKIDDSTLSFSTELFGYPVDNVKSIHLSKIWKTTGVTSEYATAFTGALNPDCGFIAGHNISESATVKIQGNNTDSWISPTVDITMTRGDEIYWADINGSIQQYWRFLIEDPTNPDGYISVGRLWLGTSIIINGPNPNFTYDYIDTTETEFSLSGQVYGDIGHIYKSYNLSFPYWDNTMKNNIITFFKEMKRSIPFFVTFTEDDTAKLNPDYVILTSNISLSHIHKLDIWNSSLSFREVK